MPSQNSKKWAKDKAKRKHLPLQFHAVARGHRTGIFRDYAEFKAQIKNYPHNKAKSFRTMEEAQWFMNRIQNPSDDALLKKRS